MIRELLNLFFIIQSNLSTRLRNYREIELNSILKVIVLTVFFFFLFIEKNGSFLYGSEGQVYLLLSVTYFSLMLNTRLKSEFLEILNVIFVVFYIFRIPFIFIPGSGSDVILRSVDIAEIDWYILLLSFQYLSLVLCIFIINPRFPRLSFDKPISEFVYSRVIFASSIIILSNVIMTFLTFDIYFQNLSNFTAILKTIFTIKSASMVIMVSSIIVEKTIFQKYKYLVFFILLAGLAEITLQGGKSGLLQMILVLYLIVLVLKGTISFRFKGLIVLAFVAILSIMLYLVAALVRNHHVMQTSVGGFTNQMVLQLFEKSNYMDWINAISYRLGYFDFYIERVSNPIYEPYVSFSYYFKSVSDKLSPGFDFFNVPFMSRALYNAFHGPDPAIMNSNLITVFGESQILLGFFSFFLFVPILIFFRYSISYFKNFGHYISTLFYVYLAYLFYWWLTGMGLDMWVTFLVYDGIFIFVIIGIVRLLERRENILKN